MSTRAKQTRSLSDDALHHGGFLTLEGCCARQPAEGPVGWTSGSSPPSIGVLIQGKKETAVVGSWGGEKDRRAAGPREMGARKPTLGAGEFCQFGLVEKGETLSYSWLVLEGSQWCLLFYTSAPSYL